MPKTATAPIDVFFCYLPGREGITARCFHAWGDLGVNFVPINSAALSCTDAMFQKQRRVYADEMATGDYYFCVDDDCLPPLGDWIEQALAIMDAHPQLAILSLWPSNANIQRWTPENYSAFEDADVMEHFSVGGVRLCRKGILKSWPSLVGKAYDSSHCEAIREAGYRVGYFRNLKMVHLGEGKTTLR